MSETNQGATSSQSTAGNGGSVSANDTVIGSSPDVALSMFYQAAGHAFALTMQNASSNQQNLNTLNPTIVSQALRLLSGA